jgi:hypothetical protein
MKGKFDGEVKKGEENGRHDTGRKEGDKVRQNGRKSKKRRVKM